MKNTLYVLVNRDLTCENQKVCTEWCEISYLYQIPQCCPTTSPSCLAVDGGGHCDSCGCARASHCRQVIINHHCDKKNIFIGYVFSLLYDYTSPHPEIHPNPNPIHPSIYSTIVSKLFCSATWRFDHYYNNDHNPLLSQSTWQRRCSAWCKVQGCFS